MDGVYTTGVYIFLHAENLLAYDDVDADVLQCYHEMTLANLLYHAMKEGACSEQSSRMTAMDSASKNAGECVAIAAVHCMCSKLCCVSYCRGND